MTPQPDIPLPRQHIRQQIHEHRRAFDPEQQRLSVQQVTEQMMVWPPVILTHTVALFLSFDGGLNTQPLIDQFWRAGKRVHLPVLHPFNPGDLSFLHHHPQSQLIVDRLEIHRPKLDVRDVLLLAELGILVTPLVAFGVSSQWLGVDGGFYDRTLQNRQQYRLRPVNYVRDCQQMDSLPSEEQDIPLPAVIIPGEIWCWQVREDEDFSLESINKKAGGYATCPRGKSG